MRLKSCAYCGRMHPVNVVCEKKPKYGRKDSGTPQARIRSGARWQRKREEIKQRDNYLCQCCLRNYPGTRRRIEYEHLSVHHIVSLEEDATKAFENENLITLCEIHHEEAERGRIPFEELIAIVKEQEQAGNMQNIPPMV